MKNQAKGFRASFPLGIVNFGFHSDSFKICKIYNLALTFNQ